MRSSRFVPSHVRKAAGIGALMLVAASVGIVTASIPGPTGVIAACYEKDGDLKLVDSEKICPKNTVRVEWNQAGQAGAPGAPGEPGQPGEPGTPGVPGATGPAGADALSPIADPTVFGFWVTGTGSASARLAEGRRIQLSTLILSNPHVTSKTGQVSLTPDLEVGGTITSAEGQSIEGGLTTDIHQEFIDFTGTYQSDSVSDQGNTRTNGQTTQGGSIYVPQSTAALDAELSPTNEHLDGTVSGTVTGTIEFPIDSYATVQLLLTVLNQDTPPTCPAPPLGPAQQEVLGRFVVPSGQTVSVPLGDTVFVPGTRSRCVTIVSDDSAVEISLFGSVFIPMEDPQEPPDEH